MPSPLARLDGDSTRLACGSARHQALEHVEPERGVRRPVRTRVHQGFPRRYAMGHDRGRDRADPHPAISSAAMTAPAAARSSFFMRI